MNIKNAKEQIENAMRAYFTKDEFGNYVIPVERQRPVFLIGPPGIGKTAIMEQIASDLDVGLVSYSMTHHTRQSALGLPFIVKKTYGGRDYDVSEYTMSEIIASVYDMIEETGHKEGILFLDEINCVSETLAPAMLQFLQYKIFGRHTVPPGWIVVTAGNPPEYNNSVREFDIVTWDRLKRIDVEPDYDAWKEYALKKGVHASVTTFLDIRKGDFYKIETTVDGKSFVTARGWDDLSDMIKLYEQNGTRVDENLISQYLQNRKIAKAFATYYDLFNKYKSDYQVERILDGKADASIKSRAKSAKFDECLSFLGLLLDGVTVYLRDVCSARSGQEQLLTALKNVRVAVGGPGKTGADCIASLDAETQRIEKEIEVGEKASSLPASEILSRRYAKKALEEIRTALVKAGPEDGKAAFRLVKEHYDKRSSALGKQAKEAGEKLSNMFVFCEEVFGRDSQQLLIVVTELTVGYYGSHFISVYGCKEYFDNNKGVLFINRRNEIISKIDQLKLDE